MIRNLRLAGFALVILGALLVVPSYGVADWSREAILAGYALLATGWVLTLAAIFLRTRERRRRMAGGV